MALIQTLNEWITLADAHELLGTVSPAQDIEVQGMIDALNALIFGYIQRDLRHAEHSEITFRPEGQFVRLNNYPVMSITSVDNDGTAVADPDIDFDINYGLGLMYYADDVLTFTGAQPKRITVQYISGYDPIPLELGVMFNTLLTDRYAAGGTTAVQSAGEIKKVSLTGVAMVEFAQSGSSVSYTGVDRLSGVPEELKPYVGLLDKYRNDELLGIV